VALDAATGTRPRWVPRFSGPVYDLAVRNGIVYIAGSYGVVVEVLSPPAPPRLRARVR
jgi:hypothetical protein